MLSREDEAFVEGMTPANQLKMWEDCMPVITYPREKFGKVYIVGCAPCTEDIKDSPIITTHWDVEED